MQEIKIKKADLLAKLVANKEKHIKEFEFARKNYVETAKQKLIEFNAAATDALRLGNNIPAFFQLPPPVSFEKSYATAIEMLDMSVDTEITLLAHEFNQYVQDEWNWSHTFDTVNSAYFTQLK